MTAAGGAALDYLPLETASPIWDRFFQVAPLVLIGTLDGTGVPDLAPKHMVTPMGWDNYFGFVCTPRHATYRNAIRERAFTVSYPSPEQLVHASLSAEPRCQDGSKASLADLPLSEGVAVRGPLLDGAHAQLECELVRVVDGFGDNSLLVGKVVSARVHADALRSSDRDDAELIAGRPLLAYVSPGYYAKVDRGFNFPLPAGFAR
jgi:flavin reductase (DIM6/NTAB) family NADH-FMN oxidoreductase RutF